MLMQQFKLFRFQLYKADDNQPISNYVISLDWNSAFNEIYKQYGDGASIVTAELIANENISLFIDKSYVNMKINSYDYDSKNNHIIINGINKYNADTF